MMSTRSTISRAVMSTAYVGIVPNSCHIQLFSCSAASSNSFFLSSFPFLLRSASQLLQSQNRVLMISVNELTKTKNISSNMLQVSMSSIDEYIEAHRRPHCMTSSTAAVHISWFLPLSFRLQFNSEPKFLAQLRNNVCTISCPRF